jgi:hypothetical protein
LRDSRFKHKARVQMIADDLGYKTEFVVKRGNWVIRLMSPQGKRFAKTQNHVLVLEGDGIDVLHRPD